MGIHKPSLIYITETSFPAVEFSAIHHVKDMWVGGELIDDLSSGSMPDLYTAVGGECGAADLQQKPLRPMHC